MPYRSAFNSRYHINSDENSMIMLSLDLFATPDKCIKPIRVPLKATPVPAKESPSSSPAAPAAPLAQSKAQNKPATQSERCDLAALAALPRTPVTSRPVLATSTPEARLKRRRSRTASMLPRQRSELKSELQVATNEACNQLRNVKSVVSSIPRRVPAHLRRCSDVANQLATTAAVPAAHKKPKDRHFADCCTSSPRCDDDSTSSQQEAIEGKEQHVVQAAAPVAMQQSGTTASGSETREQKPTQPDDDSWALHAKVLAEAAFEEVVDMCVVTMAAALRSWW